MRTNIQLFYYLQIILEKKLFVSTKANPLLCLINILIMSWIERFTSILPPKWRWAWIVAFLVAGFMFLKLIEWSSNITGEKPVQKTDTVSSVNK